MKDNERFFGHYRRFIDVKQFSKKIEFYGLKYYIFHKEKIMQILRKSNPIFAELY